MDTAIAQTQDMVDLVSRNDAMRHAYLSEWMAQMDQVGWLSQAREEGREEGWEEGWEKGQEEGWEKGQEKGQEKKALKTASNLLAMGLTPEQVSKGVELPLETVEKIAHEIKQENGSL